MHNQDLAKVESFIDQMEAAIEELSKAVKELDEAFKNASDNLFKEQDSGKPA